MDFYYIAIDPAGNKKKGYIEANSERELVEYLKRVNLSPIQIKKKGQSSLSAFGSLNGIKSSDIVVFTRQLSSMIQTGLTLLEALSVLKQQTTKPQMLKVIDDIVASISEGRSFSDALEPHRAHFSQMYISLIRAAESGGLLDTVLARLADNLEKTEDLKRKVKSALLYPSIVIMGVLVVIILLNVIVVPQLGTLYSQMDIELPLPTRIVLGMSALTTRFLPVLIGLAIGGFLLFKRFQKTETGMRTLDKLRLKTPVLGEIVRLSILDETCRTLSLLISSGASIIGALGVTANVANNTWYKAAIDSAADLVEKGVPLSKAFQNQEIFPVIMIQMAKVGESTGKIDESLLKASEYFDRDLNIKIKNLTTALEPMIIIVLGVVIGFIIWAVITPIYGIISQIQ
jgi:type IV pilus assembly protein PilC